jgi:hypothetical protein
MARDVEHFSQNYPGWELISLSTGGLKDLGGGAGSIPLMVLLLARKEVKPSTPPIAAVSTVPPIGMSSVPTGVLTTPASRTPRVLPVAAPAWALGSSFPGGMAAAINAKLASSNPANYASNPAILDVVIDFSGALLLVSAHPDPQTAMQLISDASAAVTAASPFMAIPSTASIANITDRTFTFSFSAF